MNIYKDEAEIPLTREFRDQFLCPICYDIIANAHRVFPCLHYFCKECIQKAFTTIQNVEDGKVKHHCPACRHPIPSKRHIVKDTNFDDLISALKISREEAQQDEKIDVAQYKQNHKDRVLEMKKYQEANKERILSMPYRAPASQISATSNKGKKRGRQTSPRASQVNAPEPLSEAEILMSTLSGYVNFSLKYYNAENPNDEALNKKYNLSRPYIRANCLATITDLKLLLCSYFTDKDTDDVHVYAWSSKYATMIFLESDMTLKEYCVKIWNQQTSIVFFYSFQQDVESETSTAKIANIE